MHVNSIIVEDSDIKFAERILLGKGQTFDDSRRKYIRDFSTLDLMAVPGSGKTTLLLAKLLILEKHLPLPNNNSVLVISHTNTAVKEIEDRIKIFCPRLFTYPNFVGTIQSFVNKYLALPFYESIFKKKIKSIDDKNYYYEIEKYYNSTKNYNLKSWLEKQHEPVELLKKVRFNENNNLVSYINGKENEFFLKNKDSATYKGLKQMKITLFKRGILHYDDAYYLALKYINVNPRIIGIIQKRFKHVFVDEMQDMDVHQYQLLEQIFVNDSDKTTVFQRLGDNNQAIYSDMVNSEAIWQSRENIHTINGSNRLTRLNAKFASRFSLDNSQIEGLNITTKEYKPVLVVYEQNKAKCCVMETFSKYLDGVFKSDSNLSNIVYKVVSWRRFHENKDKITLSSYCPNYIYMQKSDSISNSLLNSGIDYYNTTQIITDKVVDKFNEVDIRINDEDVTKSTLINYLKELHNEEYEKYRLYLYSLINLLFQNNYKEFYQEFNILLKNLGELFNIRKDDINLLVIHEGEFNFLNELDSDNDNKKCYRCNVMDCSPIVSSAHSTKGETHDATLFLESFYNSKYESDILHEVLCGKNVFDLLQEYTNEISQLTNEIESIENKGETRGIPVRIGKIKSLESRIRTIKQYSKLIFVALTRAKGVVGYGISKDKYDQYLSKNINKEEWEILFIE